MWSTRKRGGGRITREKTETSALGLIIIWSNKQLNKKTINQSIIDWLIECFLVGIEQKTNKQTNRKQCTSAFFPVSGRSDIICFINHQSKKNWIFNSCFVLVKKKHLVMRIFFFDVCCCWHWILLNRIRFDCFDSNEKTIIDYFVHHIFDCFSWAEMEEFDSFFSIGKKTDQSIDWLIFFLFGLNQRKSILMAIVSLLKSSLIFFLSIFVHHHH